MDGILDLFMEIEEKDFSNSHLDSGKVRAITQILLMPSGSNIDFFRRKLAIDVGATGPQYVNVAVAVDNQSVNGNIE